MINRAALLVKYKKPALDWINDADPNDDTPGLDLESVNEERTVYLIPDRAAEDDESVRLWVELNHMALLQNELSGWYTDETLWPESLDLALFDDWFDVECHSIIIDTSDEAIIEEDEEGYEEESD